MDCIAHSKIKLHERDIKFMILSKMNSTWIVAQVRMAQVVLCYVVSLVFITLIAIIILMLK